MSNQKAAIANTVQISAPEIDTVDYSLQWQRL